MQVETSGQATPAEPSLPVSGSASNAAPQVSFSSLGKGGKEVLIEHQGQLYRLRETRNGKLILNK